MIVVYLQDKRYNSNQQADIQDHLSMEKNMDKVCIDLKIIFNMKGLM